MPDDIRDKPFIGHADVVALNFITSRTPYVFRKHFRQGLRSHIMEILDPLDLQTERAGTVIDGIRWFPKARPRRMFRIFRSRLPTLEKALNEIQRVKTVERYLAPDYMATSVECIADYRIADRRELVLCGFQEYVRGGILDPWTILGEADLLPSLYDELAHVEEETGRDKTRWVDAVRKTGRSFVDRVKRMIDEAGTIPDLAGAGNLIVTAAGEIRLVDINNISPVEFDGSISLDEKGYPVSDKSIEALFLIQKKVAGVPVDRQEGLFRHFLDPDRWKRVKSREARFWKNRASE